MSHLSMGCSKPTDSPISNRVQRVVAVVAVQPAIGVDEGPPGLRLEPDLGLLLATRVRLLAGDDHAIRRDWPNLHLEQRGQYLHVTIVYEAQRQQLVRDLRDLEARRGKLFDLLELHGKDTLDLADIRDRLQLRNAEIRAIQARLELLEDAPVREKAMRIDPALAVEVMREVVMAGDTQKKTRLHGRAFGEHHGHCG